MSSKEINKLTHHVYHECSDLPSLPPIFSCSACDAWRKKAHDKGYKSIERRDFLSDRHQCRRAKEGRPPIRVRVVCKSAAFADRRISSAATLKLMEEKAEIMASLSSSERRSSRLRVKSMPREEENIPPSQAQGEAKCIGKQCQVMSKSKCAQSS